MARAAPDSLDMQYLKNDKVGKVIAQGLSQLYQQKPQKPVTFLAHWLLNHSENNKKAAEIQKKQTVKEGHVKEFQTVESKKAETLTKLNNIKEQEEGFLKSFERKIKGHEYHHELLLEELPEFLENIGKFTGVYIGELNHPNKEVTEDDTDPNAHLQVDQPKLINYIGSSKSHKSLMIGKSLALEKGVTAEVFTLAQEEVEGEEKKKKFVYVPDVIKNEKVHFFRIPKLGAYIAIPLIYKSYLYESTFDKALEERKKYLHQKDEFDKEKATHLEEIEKELEEAKIKLHAHQEKNETELVAQVEEEIKEIELRKADKEKTEMEYVEPEMETKKKEFVVCADTLGQDREITEKEQQLLRDFINKFKQSTEATELALLRKDVEHQLDYQHHLEKPIDQLMQEMEKELELDEDQTKQIVETHKEEKLINHYTHLAKLETMKKQLQRQPIRDAVIRIKDFRVLKFAGLIQHLLYFLGYSKKDIDIPHTTHLNWKHTKEIATKELLKKLLAYDFRGAKPNPVNKYAKVKYLESVFDKFPEDQVSHYNVGLGLLLRIVKLLLTVRLEDVDIRRDRTEELRKARNDLLEVNQKLEDDKLAALQTHKEGIPPEELENFNEVEWLAKYQADNPLQQVPPEVVDDVDNDI